MPRLSPSDSATQFPIGTIKDGIDNQEWVVVRSGSSKRWVEIESVKHNGFQILTVDYLAKNIGKLIEVYLCEYEDTWPNNKSFNSKIYFIPTGNGINKKSIVTNWLKTRIPAIKDNTKFSVEGYIGWYSKDTLELSSLQVESLNKKLVSTNVLNTRAFVKL